VAILELETPLDGPIERGFFVRYTMLSASFFLACLAAMELEGVVLDEL
jgi:hypothetical protein